MHWSRENRVTALFATRYRINPTRPTLPERVEKWSGSDNRPCLVNSHREVCGIVAGRGCGETQSSRFWGPRFSNLLERAPKVPPNGSEKAEESCQTLACDAPIPPRAGPSARAVAAAHGAMARKLSRPRRPAQPPRPRPT
jgi:hypothetical protein